MVNVPTAGELMAPVAFTTSPEIPIEKAIDLLASRKASGVPVIDPKGRLVGILTEKDCLRILSTDAYGEARSGGRVADFMSTVKCTVSPDMDLFGVAHLFLDSNFPSLPVLDGEHMVGMISRQDMLRGIQHLQREIERVQREEGASRKTMQSPRSIAEMQQLFANQRPEHIVGVLSQRYGPRTGNE